VSGRWLAPRRLATPIDQRCVALVAGDPACHPDALLRVQPDGDGGAPVEFVTSVALDALPAVPAGDKTSNAAPSLARSRAGLQNIQCTKLGGPHVVARSSR
jgi:hypothetical protein